MIGQLSKMVCKDTITINNYTYIANTVYMYRACLFVAGDISQYSVLKEDGRFFIGYLTPVKLREHFMTLSEWKAELDRVDVMFELILNI